MCTNKMVTWMPRPKSEFDDCIKTLTLTNLTPSEDIAQLRVVWCTLAQPEQVNNQRTVIFQTCTKIRSKSCKVIVDSGSCINVVASKLITTLGMKSMKHSNPYKVIWINTTSTEVQEMLNSHPVCHVHR